MAMIATDELTNGQLIDLPSQAGDVNQPRFEPDEAWLQAASPVEQKTALWHWFATRHEELASSTPHDGDGNFFFGAKEPPVDPDRVLRERFGRLVPATVLDELIGDIRRRGGERWAHVVPDQLGS